MTRINNIVKDTDAEETLLDQFDLDFVTDDLENELAKNHDDEMSEDLVDWVASLNRF